MKRDSIKSVWIPALSLSRPSLLHGGLSATLQNSLSIAISEFDYLSPTLEEALSKEQKEIIATYK